MHTIYPSDNKAFTLNITIKCSGTKKFRIWAEDLGKPNSRYADRIIVVEGQRDIFFSFPVSPPELFIGCKNAENVSDEDFTVQILQTPLIDYNIYLDREAKDFIQFAKSLIKADNNVSDDEHRFYILLKNLWNLN